MTVLSAHGLLDDLLGGRLRLAEVVRDAVRPEDQVRAGRVLAVRGEKLDVGPLTPIEQDPLDQIQHLGSRQLRRWRALTDTALTPWRAGFGLCSGRNLG